MQHVLIEKPYQFVPRVRSNWQQKLLLKTPLLERTLRKQEGVVAHECRNVDRLQKSLDAGHGILLTPNHPRTADPMAMYHVSRAVGQNFYTMASWHLFNHSWLKRKVLGWMGAFSINREGMDRQAIDEAIEILQTAERPLVIFPEGTTSRTNDQLMTFMEGPAFIARTAAKRRAKKDDGIVVTHPVAIKYYFDGDIEKAAADVLNDIEHRLTWKPQKELPLIDRLIKIGNALLTLKELEYGIEPNFGDPLKKRQDNLVNFLLVPLEEEWLGGAKKDDGIAVRIKNLRVQIFPEMSRAEIEPVERERRWKQLADTYLAQQIACYPDRYVVESPSVDRILETCEKFEEDMTDKARLHGNLKVVINIGEPIEVSTKRERGVSEDPLMSQIRADINAMLLEMQAESKMYQPG